MKGARVATPFLASRGAKFLIALPLVLAAFALLLQARARRRRRGNNFPAVPVASQTQGAARGALALEAGRPATRPLAPQRSGPCLACAPRALQQMGARQIAGGRPDGAAGVCWLRSGRSAKAPPRAPRLAAALPTAGALRGRAALPTQAH